MPPSAPELIEMGAVLAVDEAKQLLKLCDAGRLYEVEAWIRAGKSLTVPKEVRKTPLTVAMSTSARRCS